MKLITDLRAVFFNKITIPLEFLILHYTAQSLKASLDIFVFKPTSEVSTHLLIGEEGEIYELVPCWNSGPYEAFHAGRSRFEDAKGRIWENFNKFSLGIEIVNGNGNFFSFREKQYESLRFIFNHLKTVYPALKDPNRILGHEHIAGYRGKKDPGFLFDWAQLLKENYPDSFENEMQKKAWLETRKSVLTESELRSLSFLLNMKWTDRRARKISILLEKPYPFWIKKLYLKLMFWLGFWF